jgi:pimeloyl-ACP methyl ester carboxylesterase
MITSTPPHKDRLSFIGASGNRLAADASGPANGRPVLLLHGGGQTRHSWDRAREVLGEAGYYAISVDARGHGESEWDENGDYTLEAQVNDLRAIVETLHERPVLVGASMGGVNSLIACGQNPALAAALVMVDVTPRLEIKGVERIRAFMTSNPDGFASLEDAADAIAAYTPSRRRSSGNVEGLRKNLRKHEDGRWRWHWDPKFMEGDHQAKIAHISKTMFEAADHIAIPSLLVRGRESDVVSMEGVHELQAHIPTMEFVDVEGAGHMVAGDKNDAFNAAILDFLGRQFPVQA